MAYCPQCETELPATAPDCPQCGYNFAPQAPARKGLAYSWVADVALAISAMAAMLGAVASVIAAIKALIESDLYYGLLVWPVAFFLQIGLFVVFVRVGELGKGHSA